MAGEIYNNPKHNSRAKIDHKIKEVEEVITMLNNTLKYARLKLKEIKDV